MSISTVKIASAETASGYMLINEGDFDASKHELWEPEAAPAAPEPDAGKPLDRMTLAELRDYAKARGIPIPAAITAKADVLAHVLAAESAGQPQAH